jgi:hypothetical protein
MSTEKTLGEQRVQTDFNAGGSDVVTQIKAKSAELINAVNELRPPEDAAKVGSFMRLQALAMTAYEEAAMWAVKAATR